ncbi:MAG: NTPase [Candidatus Diapherotrites archaeon ADurb.Bin253]|mgnify:FL=1|jgi:inosine/xanthosine triphosphatase|nr:MAG: NTPase [Candidatus Diapherotrites archaeon ADurb.Bin253]
MKVAIGTENKAKIKAVESIIKEVWKDVEFSYHKTNSLVKDQPLSDEEAIKGAINRAKEAINKGDADYGIGLEGTVNTNNYGMFLHGWVTIVDKYGNIGFGQSASVHIPKTIEQRIKKGEELGPIIQELMNDEKNSIRHNEGTNGILTGGLYTRVKEFEDATRCALSRFVAPEWYS